MAFTPPNGAFVLLVGENIYALPRRDLASVDRAAQAISQRKQPSDPRIAWMLGQQFSAFKESFIKNDALFIAVENLRLGVDQRHSGNRSG